MDIPWRAALLVVAAAFLVFLLAKLLPRQARRGGGGPSLSAAKARAAAAKSDRERAEALCDAAEAALAAPFGTTRAAAYFMRAMRADPKWPGAPERAAAALGGRRGGTLRKMMWRRLAATPWDAAHGPAVRAIAASILAASGGEAATSPQAIAIKRLLAGEALRLPRA